MFQYLLLATLSFGSQDPQAVFDKVDARFATAKTVQGTMTLKLTRTGQAKPLRIESTKFIFKRPTQFVILSEREEIRSNGDELWVYYPSSNQYQHRPNFRVEVGNGYHFNPYVQLVGKMSASLKRVQQVPSFGQTVWQGHKAAYMELKGLPIDPDGWVRSYVAIESGIPLGYERMANSDLITVTYENVRVDESVDESVFSWKPPQGATAYNREEETRQIVSKLLKKGVSAPDFKLASFSGGEVTLSEAVKGKKLTLLNFWFYNCGPCRAELPEIEKLYAKLKDQGFQVLSVNHGDAPELISRVVKQNGHTFTVLMNGGGQIDITPQYGVQAFPTNYLVDSEGKIVAALLGYNAAEFESHLRAAGFKL